MITQVTNQQEYHQAMAVIEGYLSKEASVLTETELADLQRLSLLVERYEDVRYPMPVEPPTLPEMIRLRMFQEHLKQRDLAALLGITETRLSEVLTGKRKINLDLAKRLYEKLKIRADFILEKA